MKIERFVISPLQSNCYVVSESEDPDAKAVVIDPGDTALSPVLTYIEEHRLKLTAVWCTHGHFDHVLGTDELRRRYGVPIFLHRSDFALWQQAHEHAKMWLNQDTAPLSVPDRFWTDGDVVSLGETSFSVWHTPGHSPGGVCLVGESIVFTGDTLFAGTIGRTDFPESDAEAMKSSLHRLLNLADTTQLYPGHMQATAMGHERKTNPFLLEL
ncbi:MBL fold metallo-hydrolase [Alicyclobacillus sp. SO9]|uniref:MBL fold metallo-hydrolase n=1 Tax=Alicyclobacillus sp. SO9 TaxID=2665646 RepID=UPI0018E7A3AC|nr:MBL fold metallo-hydrolase [Alicyclobacillus sp. SO9]QQE77447.1 MBL fold metallo-hydrolase [Alicyclobacillus sp. SO9]